MRIEPMSRDHASEYIGWEYASPYEFYNIPLSCFDEAMDEISGDNGMDYYSVLDEDAVLFGMFEFSFPDGIMEIGLGIRPECCGKGNGRNFVKKCISFGREKYAYSGKIRLTVADFNSRAIHLYRSVGFCETERRISLSFGSPVTFVVMELADNISF